LSAINKRKYNAVPSTLEKTKPSSSNGNNAAKCSLAGPSDDEQKRVDRELTTLRQTSRRMREKNTQLRIEMKRLRKEKTDEESQSGRMKDRARETRKQRKKHSFDLAHYLIRKRSTIQQGT